YENDGLYRIGVGINYLGLLAGFAIGQAQVVAQAAPTPFTSLVRVALKAAEKDQGWDLDKNGGVDFVEIETLVKRSNTLPADPRPAITGDSAAALALLRVYYKQ